MYKSRTLTVTINTNNKQRYYYIDTNPINIHVGINTKKKYEKGEMGVGYTSINGCTGWSEASLST